MYLIGRIIISLLFGRHPLEQQVVELRLILNGHLHRAVVHPLIIVRRRRARQDSIGVLRVIYSHPCFAQLLAQVVGALEGAVSAAEYSFKYQRVERY